MTELLLVLLQFSLCNTIFAGPRDELIQVDKFFSDYNIKDGTSFRKVLINMIQKFDTVKDALKTRILNEIR